MVLITMENISKSYGEKLLFKDISFGINEGEKIGLIGVNGTGKSTLLKIIAGLESPDRGEITHSNGLRMEYLPQNPSFDGENMILEQVFKGYSPKMSLIRDYEKVLKKLESCPEDRELQKKLAVLGGKMDESGAWDMESSAKSVLTKLGIKNFDAKVKNLSGGERKRVALAGVLINPSDIILLDEPTNQLDNETVDWLENYLKDFKGAFVMVTHDRYFLDRAANRIIELDGGQLYTYQGNYSVFLEKKIERQDLQKSREEKMQKLLIKELAWMRKGAKARGTKQKARIERFEKLRDQEVETAVGMVEISSPSSRLGGKVISLDHICKSFKGRPIIDDFSYTVLRNDRVGIIGPNGIGKTTLIKIMSGMLAPDSGNVDTGTTVRIGYYAQEQPEIDSDLRVIDYIRNEAEYLKTSDGEKLSASQMLERFLFPPEMQYNQVSKLSGGEKRRLSLLKVLMDAPNVLLLDEPTNDLDIETLEVLEDYIDGFSGAVVAVSHDRYFLDRIAGKIFAFEESGRIRQYTGNYDVYVRNKPAEKKSEDKRNAEGNKKEETTARKKERPLKFTFKEQREFEQIDGVISETEDELEKVNKQIDGAGSDFELLQEAILKQQEIKKKLDELMERWVYLNELAEKIDACGEKGTKL